MGDDKRSATRYTIWFPMKLQAEDEPERVAVSRNVSESGLLMATGSDLEIGSPVTVSFQLDSQEERRTVDARIVRCEENSQDPDGLWPFYVAVEFDSVLDELEPVLSRVAEKQKDAGLG